MGGKHTPSRHQLDQLYTSFVGNRYIQAQQLARALVRQYPEHPFAWKILGGALYQIGKVSEALDPSEMSVRLAPRDPEARNNFALVLRDLGNVRRAEEVCRETIMLTPNLPDAYNLLGTILQAGKQMMDAERAFRRAIDVDPRHPQALNNLGVLLKANEQLDEAAIYYERAIVSRPTFARAHHNLGVVFHALGRLDESEGCYRKAIELQPDYGRAHLHLSILLSDMGQRQAASDHCQRALELNPKDAEAHRYYAVMQQDEIPKARIADMQNLLCDDRVSDSERCHLYFGLATAYDRSDDLARAMDCYVQGNRLRKTELGYDRFQDVALFQAIENNTDRIQECAVDTGVEPHDLKPVFVLGMPRSGTTLIEHIVSAHPLVTGAGELPFVGCLGAALARGVTEVTPSAVETFRSQYLERLRLVSDGKSVVTDKMPLNFRYIGLLVSAFPEASIVLVERNPAAVCWANYTQYFASPGIQFCYDLDDLVQYYHQYQNLIKFWRETYPGRLYCVDYDALTRDLDTHAHALISHLGLEWDDRCAEPENNRRAVATASNLQVRRPVYQGSSEKWKRFRPYLAGKLDCFDIV